MAEGIKTPPKFDGLNFFIWKVKMTVFLQSLGSWVAKAATKPFSVLLLKTPYHFILVRLDDVMLMGTKLDLMDYVLIASKVR